MKSIRSKIALLGSAFSAICALGLLTLAFAAAKAPDERSPDLDTRIRAALKNIHPDLVPDYIGPAAAPGYREVLIKGQVVFVTNDGNYLIQGLSDLRNRRDIAQSGALPSWRLRALDRIPESERIVFAPSGTIKHTVIVFTDAECGFCQKFHRDIGEYNRLGIAVEYIAFPRAGMGTPDARKMESIWCSKDRKKALTDAKRGRDIPPLSCANPVAKQHEVGMAIGLQGTPMIINADGVALPGYLPPEKLLEALDRLQKQAGGKPRAA